MCWLSRLSLCSHYLRRVVGPWRRTGCVRPSSLESTMAKRVGGSTATATRPPGWHFGHLGAVLMLDDGTQELIRNHMAGRGIPDELHQRPGITGDHPRR